MSDTFDEWMGGILRKEALTCGFSTLSKWGAAEAAWDHQQEIIDALEQPPEGGYVYDPARVVEELKAPLTDDVGTVLVTIEQRILREAIYVIERWTRPRATTGGEHE